MCSYLKTIILLIVLSAHATFARKDYNPDTLAAIFVKYDLKGKNEPDECQPEYVSSFICPSDDKIPCGKLSEIKTYCRELLGSKITTAMATVKKNMGYNSINGCVKYVGMHVKKHGHFACCESEYCNVVFETRAKEAERKRLNGEL